MSNKGKRWSTFSKHQGWRTVGCDFLQTVICTHTHTNKLETPFSKQYNCDFSPLTSHSVSYYKENTLLIWPLSPAPSGQIAFGTSSYSHNYSSPAKPKKESNSHIYSHTRAQENHLNVPPKHFKCERMSYHFKGLGQLCECLSIAVELLLPYEWMTSDLFTR